VSQPPLKSRRTGDAAGDDPGAGLRVRGRARSDPSVRGARAGLTIAGLIAGGLVGLLLTVWVVGIRALLRDRAVLDRWVADVTAALRSSSRIGADPGCWPPKRRHTDLAAHDEVESATAADRVAGPRRRTA